MAEIAMSPSERNSRRRVALSSCLGTTIEYYDFLLYGTVAALVFNKVFFTNLSPLVGTIVALATLAAGYVARLAGAIVFGHFGDRLGRKSVMLTTMIVMGLSSGLIGVLPGYAQIGAAAPLLLLLLRLLQGLAVGGEFGGAVLMTAEHAGPRRRGLSTSAATLGAPIGALLATVTVTGVTLLPADQLISWGWRVPFLASFALLAVGVYFRTRVLESPVFLADRGAQAGPRPAPVLELFRRNPGRMLQAVVVQIGPYCGQGVFGIFVISYTTSIGYPRSAALLATSAGLVGAIVMTPLYALISDRIGRKPVLIFAGASLAVTAYPLFLAINSRSTALLVVAVVGYLTFILTAATSVGPVLLSELFPTGIRYTSVSASYQLAQTVGSGFGPLIGASLLAAAGGGTHSWAIAAFLVVVGLISAATSWLLPETRAESLTTATRQAGSVAVVKAPTERGV
ncbi:MAG TPA: MFS transporter [Amycolatopsis sp.]|uniref:MFS transporter n=1 Tax=Amycolatopsis sp. TaxID=37632 RepID=UPI002B49D840|nr:MFS transporter [Amycolatopsis sp.]HKS50220.1 MFS transporter [Amycolatopsis sp.]